MYSVAEFAEAKGITAARVRALIASGEISARRVGASYVLEAEALRWQPKVCRPLGAANRKLLLDHLSSSHIVEMDVKSKSRLKTMLRKLAFAREPARLYRDLLSGRQPARRFSCQPDDLTALREDNRVVCADASIPRFQMVSGGVVHLEVAPQDFSSVVDDFWLRPNDSGDVWLWEEPDFRQDPLVYAIANLYTSGGVRERAAADRVLRELLEARCCL